MQAKGLVLLVFWLGTCACAWAQVSSLPVLEVTDAEREWLAAHPVVRIGVDPGYAPYAFFDDDGHFQGVAADFTSRIAQLLGVRMEVVPGLSWPEILDAARARRLDMVTTAVKLRDRTAYLNFTRVYIPTPLVIVTREQKPRLQDAEQLSGLRVALVEGYSSSRQVRQRSPRIRPHLVATPLAGLRAVASGAADAYVGVLGVNTYLTRQHGLSNLKVNTAFDMVENGQRFGVRSDWPELAVLLDKALAAIPKADQDAIFRRWLPVRAEQVPVLGSDLNLAERRWLGAHTRVRVGVRAAGAPFDFMDRSGRHAGIAMEFLDLVGRHTGLKFETRSVTSQARADELLRDGAIDLVAAAVDPAGETHEIRRGRAYYQLSLMVFAPKERLYTGAIGELRGKTAALVRGGFAADYLARHPAIGRLAVDNIPAALEAVADGRADVAVLPAAPALDALASFGLTGVRAASPLAGGSLPLSFSVRADWSRLVDIIDRRLARITPEERMLILRKWLVRGPEHLNRALVVRWALWVGALVLFGYLLILIWNRQLRREVARRQQNERQLLSQREAEVIARERVQDALRDSESRLRTLFDTLPDLIWLKDPEGVYLACNVRFERFFGASEAALLGRTDADFKDGALAGRFHEKDQAVLAVGGPTVNEEWVIYADDGHRELLETIQTPMYDAQGQLVGVLGIGRDITARKGAEDEARRREAELASVFEALPDLFFRTAFDGTILDYRARDRGDLYRPPADFLGRRMQQVLPSALARQFEAGLSRLRGGRDMVTYEYELDTPKGGRRFEARLVPLAGRQELIAIVRDVSESHRARAALQSACDRNDLILKTTLEGYILADTEGWLLDVNPAYCQLLGYSREALLGMNIRDLEASLSEEELVERIRSMVSAGGARFETRHRHRDRHAVDLDVSIAIMELEGRPLVAAFVSDISERKRAEHALREAQAELEQRVEERTAELRAANLELEAFAYSVSHDLRAPLRAIAGFGQALVEDYGDSLEHQARDFLERMIRGSVRMGELIDGLLKLSRSTRGTLERVEVDLSALAVGVLEDLRSGEPERGVRIEIQADLKAQGDPRLLKSVLENLLGNAWKYTADTADPAIAFSGRRDRGSWTYCVADNGAGFDMRYVDKLFKPFQRLHSQQSFPGVGIGLATVGRIVQRHGGWIRAHGEERKGARFCFTLEPNAAERPRGTERLPPGDGPT